MNVAKDAPVIGVHQRYSTAGTEAALFRHPLPFHLFLWLMNDSPAAPIWLLHSLFAGSILSVQLLFQCLQSGKIIVLIHHHNFKPSLILSSSGTFGAAFPADMRIFRDSNILKIIES